MSGLNLSLGLVLITLRIAALYSRVQSITLITQVFFERSPHNS